MGEPGGLWFRAPQRVRQDWSDLAGTHAPLEKVLLDYPSPNDSWLSFPRWCRFISHWQNSVTLTAVKPGKITYLALVASSVRQTRGRRGEGTGNGWHSNNVCYHCVCVVCVWCVCVCAVLSRSVVSDSLGPHGLKSAKLLCPWGFSRQEYWSG